MSHPSHADRRASVEDAADQTSRVAFIAFDLLREGRRDLRDRPLTERRVELERLFGRTGSPILRISDQVRGDAFRDLVLALPGVVPMKQDGA